MLCVFPTFNGDIRNLIRLLEWINELGPCKEHDALIVADFSTQYSEIFQAKEIAQKSFREVRFTATGASVAGWPRGGNVLFHHAATYINDKWPQHFLWVEPDAIPIRAGWVDAIWSAYCDCKKPFMGHIYDSGKPNMPIRVMSGIAVYPSNAINVLPQFVNLPRAWDITSGDVMVAQGHHTPLIHHLWGEMGNPPKFADKNIPGTSTFSLEQIAPECVLWHRNKDGSLIKQLKKSHSPGNVFIPKSNFVVVLPFFNRDASLALKNIQWQHDLGGCSKYEVVLSFESNVNPTILSQIEQIAHKTYAVVHRCKYGTSSRSNWPYGPNWAFQKTAAFMHQMQRSWLWNETDMFALSSNWLDVLQSEYMNCGKAFMGHVVKDFGHLQGTSIYPPDLPLRCPKVMSCSNIAFDTVSKHEMLSDCHAANNLFYHVWGLHGDQPHHFTGLPIHFSTIEQVKRWIPEGAVTMHRCKDGSIVDRLREMRK